MPRSTAYLEGQAAASSSAYTPNPYDDDTTESGDWVRGWNDTKSHRSVVFSFKGTKALGEGLDKLLVQRGGSKSSLLNDLVSVALREALPATA